jgi:hypothetical protein
MNADTRAELRAMRSMLQSRASELAQHLAPGGREARGVYEAPNPTRNDTKAGSFKIVTRGPKAGSFVDYAGVNAPFTSGGDRGDVIDLIAYIRCGRSRKDAIRWARDWLGLSRMSDTEKKYWAEAAKRQKREAEARQRKMDNDRLLKVMRLSANAHPNLIGTLAERYLAGRQITLSAIPHLNHEDLRFRQQLEWWRGASKDQHGRRVPGPSFPAIICNFRNRHGVLTAVHCTFLDPLRASKADVEAPKLMFGEVSGCVVEISHGPSGLSPANWLKAKEAGLNPAAAPVILAEGLEDSTTLAEAAPECRVWMTGSLGNISQAPVDHPCVSAVFVARDNAWGRVQATEAFERAAEALASHGKPFAEMSALLGKDFNDQAQTGI